MRFLSTKVLIAIAMGLLLLPACVENETNSPEPQPMSEIRRVVVIHLDATRTDAFGCYGGIAETPAIDALAAKGLRFTNTVAPTPKTSPAAASFLTGRLVPRNGVFTVGVTLNEEYVTLTELLKNAGFLTAAFVSNGTLAPLHSGKATGFDQGFDIFEYIVDRPESQPGVERNAVPRASAIELTKAAMRFVDKYQDDRFFLWVFHLDPHAPYSPPPPYDTMYLDHEGLVEESVDLQQDQIHQQALVSHRLESHEYIARYLGEVVHTDLWVGKLLAQLDGLPGATLVVLLADHGESLGEHDYWFGHGWNIHGPCVNVPLIMACEGVVPVGTCKALTANIDVPVTILDLLGIDHAPLDADGLSLRPAFTEPSPWPDRLVPLQASRGDNWRGVRTESFSFQRFTKLNTVPQTFLYDVERDPRETTNVIEQHEELAGTLAKYLMESSTTDRAHSEGTDLRDDPEMSERLKSLGYIE